MKRKPILEKIPSQRQQEIAQLEAIPVAVKYIPQSQEVLVEHLRYTDPNRVIERAKDGGDEVVARLGQIPLSHLSRTPEQVQREAKLQVAFDDFMHGDK